MTTIVAGPTVPLRSMVQSVFRAAMDAFLAWLVTFATQLEAARGEVNTNNTNSLASAAAASASAGATLWVSGQSVTRWTDERISPLNGQTYRRITATGSGTTDPSLDTTNYVPISFSPLNSPTFVNPNVVGLRTNKVAFTGTTPTLDMSTGDLFTGTIGAATAFALSNVPASGTVCEFFMEIVNGNAFVITWWSGIQWDGGAAPALSTSGKDLLGFYSYDGGVTWVGALLQQGIA